MPLMGGSPCWAKSPPGQEPPGRGSQLRIGSSEHHRGEASSDPKPRVSLPKSSGCLRARPALSLRHPRGEGGSPQAVSIGVCP